MIKWCLFTGLILLGGWSTARAEDSIKAINADLQKLFKSGQPKDEQIQELVARCTALADADIGTDKEFDALMTAMRISGFGSGAELQKSWSTCLDRMIEGFIDSAKLAEVVPTLARSRNPDAAKALERIEKETKVKETKAACLYAQLGQKVDQESEGSLSDADRLATIKDLKQLVATYGDLKDPNGRTYKEVAEGNITVLEKFHIGATAPDIEGKDLEGVGFKLSDYRGKVVLLDFWGDW